MKETPEQSTISTETISQREPVETHTVKSVGLTDFVRRQFKPDFIGTQITSHTPEEFSVQLNSRLKEAVVKVGYADFVRVAFVENFTDAKEGSVLITPKLQDKVKSSYQARRPTELPVLVRWVEGVEAPQAAYLGIALYSREQLEAERAASGDTTPLSLDDDWGVVKIMGLPTPEDEPIEPTTMLRNALGKEYGGSGEPLDRDVYLCSIEYWNTRIRVK